MKLVVMFSEWIQEEHLMNSITSLQKYMKYSSLGSQYAVPGEVDKIYKDLLTMYHEQYGGK